MSPIESQKAPPLNLRDCPPTATRDSRPEALCQAYGSDNRWLQRVQLVAAVAPRGYMLLCLLHWDARPIRGRIADGGRCRASMPGLIFAMALMVDGKLWRVWTLGTTKVESAVAGSSVAVG